MSFTNIKPDIFSQIYALKSPQELLMQEVIRVFEIKIDPKVPLKTWIVYSSTFILKPNRKYPISLVKEPYKLLATMLCRFYEVDNYQYFKMEWMSLAYYVATTGAIFNWVQIFSVTLKDVILQVQKP